MRHKLSRAARSPNAHYQLGSILLLLTQSFVAPIIIGLDSFGSQVLFLAPLLLCQALFEATCQAEMNHSQSGSERTRLNATSLFLPAMVLGSIALILNNWISDRPLWLASIVIGTYFINTALLAFAFASAQPRVYTLANYGLLAAYVVTFSVSLSVAPGYEIIIANIAAFGVSAAIIVTMSQRRVTAFWGSPDFGSVLASASYRLPIICFNSLTTIILGATGASAAAIGQFRIVLSAINAGRYFNLVPLARLQHAIHQRTSELSNLAKQYLASFLVFQVAMVAVFPEVYTALFGDREFTRLSIYLASMFILLQPLTYAAFRRGSTRPNAVALISIFSAACLVAIFALSLGWAEPTMAMAVASIVAVTFYAVIAIDWTRLTT